MNFSLFAPTRVMFAISVIFACLALISAAAGNVPFLSDNAVWVMGIAFVVLAVSCLVRMTESVPTVSAPSN